MSLSIVRCAASYSAAMIAALGKFPDLIFLSIKRSLAYFPFIIYALASILRWFVITGRYNLMAFCLVTVFLYCAIMVFWWPALLLGKYDWITRNLPWYMDMEFFVKVPAPAVPVSFVAYMMMPWY